MRRNKSVTAKPKRAPRAPRKPRAQYNAGTPRDLSGVEDYRHDQAKRVNNPPAALASYDKGTREKPKQFYPYDPHLSPQLVWAGKAGLNAIEVEERACLEVDTVPLYIHERVSSQAIVRAITRPEMKQLSLFADRAMPLHEAVEFYQHEMDWANRLILGDSLLVMNSLLQRERMAGKVQMIFIDPPYGVKFSSNFQPRIDRREVKDDDESLTREPEQIQAYRDTWELGVHSYLTYLRDRLLIARDLLAETGSIFVQISDENLHRVRLLMDEIFGEKNRISQVSFLRGGAQTSKALPSVSDFLLWYSRDIAQLKLRTVLINDGGWAARSQDLWVETPDGSRNRLPPRAEIPRDGKVFTHRSLESATGGTSSRYPIEHEGKTFNPKRGWSTTPDGIERLRKEKRLLAIGDTLRFVVYLTDYPFSTLTNNWTDTIESGFASDKIYVVQTAQRVIQRCMLMTTDPSDLVFDPTCGSGTTAFVAEQWGRRWITCDTSRVALNLARQRLLTATFPYYKITDESRGVCSGFIYKTVPHITLKSIAQNEPAETSTLYDQPETENKKVRVSGPFTVEAIAPAAEDLSPNPFPSKEGEPNSPLLRGEGQGERSAGEHITTLIELLRKDGVTFPNNKKMSFTSLTPLSGGILHAEGEAQNGKTQRVAISFGPLHGPITVRQVEDGLSEAHRGGYDSVVFCGFAFDGDAQTAIQRDPHPRVRAFMAHIRPDVLMSDLLKTTATSQLFTVFGEPDLTIKHKGEKFVITVRGVDVYNPLDGSVTSARAEQISAWFLDTDYDRRTFCIVQAFFPNKSAWEKLQRALKSTLNEDAFDKLTGTESLPFIAGEHKRAAIKVIDHRGNEVMRVVTLD